MDSSYVAFHQGRLVATGTLAEVARVLAGAPEEVRGAALIFDAGTSEQADIHFEGATEQVVASTAAREHAIAERRGRGRPKLGVVAREVTLLPRHWDWLADQPGGASVALRKLVDAARRANSDRDLSRRGQEATYRFMAATCGDLPGFEEALRALFAVDADAFDVRIAEWPDDLRAHIRELSRPAFWLAQKTPPVPPALPDATGA